MLMALAAGRRVAARTAERADAHRCPGCGGAVLLKRGCRVVAHFAHARAADCAWARGETIVHLGAKASIAAALAGRGLDVALEVELLSSDGDRRADILVRHPRAAQRIAIEIQHSPLTLDQITLRTRAYAAAGVPVIWIATLDWSRLPWRNTGSGRVIDRYVAAPWQRYAAAYHGQLWFWAEGTLWRGWLQDAWVANAREETGWARSARWTSLGLDGPFPPASVRIAARASRVEAHEAFALPPGFAANLIAPPAADAAARPPTVTQWSDSAGVYVPRIVSAPKRSGLATARLIAPTRLVA